MDNYLEGYHVPVAHPGLMRLLDYQSYVVAEETESCTLSEVRLRDKSSSNLAERLYQRLARPMPGLAATAPRVWRYAAVYLNTLVVLYPGHSTLPSAYHAKVGEGLRTELARRLHTHIGRITNDEDADLEARVLQVLATPGYQPTPLSHREAGAGWYHPRIRRDLGARYNAAGDSSTPTVDEQETA
jgi:Rieske 2Fe-2S family protein